MNKNKLASFIFAFIAFFALAPSIASASVEKVSAFVCPVITQEAVGENNPNAAPLGTTDTYTVAQPTDAAGGDLMLPVNATNMDGAGVPGGPQSQPGDNDYTAIWAQQ